MKITDPVFERVYNKKIVTALEKKFGPSQQRHVDLTYASQSMLDLADKMNKKQRRGEVVIVAPNQQGRVWLHTKSFYPDGVYRLLSGGMEVDEKPHQALQREALEETGLKVKIERCLAVITYTLRQQEDEASIIPFVSYVFLTKPKKAQPQPLDPEENIADFKAVPVSALTEVADNLSSIEGYFADWGKFRAVAHQVVADLLL